MKSLAFERIPKTWIAVATVGQYRLQIWRELRDCYFGPVNRLRWGAAAFEHTAVGLKRLTPDRFFCSREEAIRHLAILAEAMKV